MMRLLTGIRGRASFIEIGENLLNVANSCGVTIVRDNLFVPQLVTSIFCIYQMQRSTKFGYDIDMAKVEW